MQTLKIGETEIKSNHIKFGFGGEGKTGASKEKPLGGEQRATCNKLNPLTTSSLGIKPGPVIGGRQALSPLHGPFSPNGGHPIGFQSQETWKNLWSRK